MAPPKKTQPIQSAYIDRLRALDMDDFERASETVAEVCDAVLESLLRGKISGEERTAVMREANRVIRELMRRNIKRQ